MRALLLAGCAVATTSLLMLLQQPQTGVGHDLVSFVAPIDGFLDGYSQLYASFFNDTPPGIHTVLLPWIWLFSSHPWSMYVLHVLLLLVHQATLLRVLLLNARFSISLAVFTTVSFIAIQQDVFGDMLLTTELLGNVLLFLSFWIYSKHRSSPLQRRLRAYVASLSLLTYAFWVREVYVFAIIVFVCLIAFREVTSRRNFLLWCKVVSWSALVGTAPVAVLLTFTEGVGPYLFVLEFKRDLYPLPSAVGILVEPLRVAERFIGIMGWPSSLALGVLTAVGCWSSRHRNFTLSAIGLVGVSGFAFAWQGKEMSGHYLAALLPPIALALLAAGRVTCSIKGPKYGPLVLGLVLLVPTTFLPPNGFNPLTDVATPSTWWSEVGSKIGSNEGRTLSIATSDGACLQRAYGWAAGMSYRLNKLPPCSKYFLPNLIVDSPFHQLQFKLELLQQPPAVVLYSSGTGADLNVAQFEQRAAPWSAILRTCYQSTTLATEFVTRKSDAVLRDCLTRVMADQIFANLREVNKSRQPWENLLTPP